MNQGSRSQGLARGLEILCLFANKGSEWGVTALARRMNLHKSQVHRALKTLEESGFLRQNPKTGRYLLGWRAYEIGVAAGQNFGVIPEIRSFMRKLTEESGATVTLRIMDGSELVVVECVEGSGVLRVLSPIGTRLPWNFSSGGKLISAFSPKEWVEEMIETYGLSRYTSRTIVQKTRYLRELVLIRKQGHAISNGEGVPGAFSVAAPIFQPDDELMGALQAALPSAECTAKERPKFVRKVLQTASDITRLIASRANGKGTRETKKSRILEMITT